jgi:hypothetical protein
MHNAPKPIPAGDLRENSTCQMHFVPKSRAGTAIPGLCVVAAPSIAVLIRGPRSGKDSLFEEAIRRAPVRRAGLTTTRHSAAAEISSR